MMQKDMVEKKEIGILDFSERIAETRTVKELLDLDKEVTSSMSETEIIALFYSMFLTIDNQGGSDEQLTEVINIVAPFKELFPLINKRLLELIPNTEALVKALEIIHDDEMRKRLLWRWEILHQNSL